MPCHIAYNPPDGQFSSQNIVHKMIIQHGFGLLRHNNYFVIGDETKHVDKNHIKVQFQVSDIIIYKVILLLPDSRVRQRNCYGMHPVTSTIT